MQREGNPTNRLLGGMTIGIPLILVLASAGCTSGGAHSGSSTNEVGPGTGSTVTPPPSPAGPGGLIVLRRNPDDSAFTIYTVRPDGTALTQLTHPPEGDNDTHPWLSPDGSQVVFERSVNANASSSTNPEHDTLMVINTDGTGLHQLIPACRGACSRACALAKLPCPGDNYPAWSPDGTRIAFERAYGPNLRHLTVAIWVANADGSDARQLTQPKPASEDHSPNWFPNGRRIVFNRFDDSVPNGGQGTIYMIGAYFFREQRILNILAAIALGFLLLDPDQLVLEVPAILGRHGVGPPVAVEQHQLDGPGARRPHPETGRAVRLTDGPASAGIAPFHSVPAPILRSCQPEISPSRLSADR